jgi:hypothetical protein
LRVAFTELSCYTQKSIKKQKDKKQKSKKAKKRHRHSLLIEIVATLEKK